MSRVPAGVALPLLTFSKKAPIVRWSEDISFLTDIAFPEILSVGETLRWREQYSMHKILVIDDDEVLLRLVSINLGEAGYSVLSTADGPRGIALYREQKPSLVLLDLGLPTMSGVEVLKEIRALDSSAKVIVVTGYGSVESAVTAMRFGAWDYVQKPFDMDVLLKKMETALSSVGE